MTAPRPIDRLLSKVVREGDCWLWQGASVPRGYGVMRFNGRQTYAHRVSYQLHVGPIPPGHFVLHRCDVPACCNPAHLFTGTPAENTQDMLAKGRHRTRPPTGDRNGNRIRAKRGLTLRGDQNPRTVVTTDVYREITRLRGQGLIQREIAERVGVSRSHIGNILRGATWHTCSN